MYTKEQKMKEVMRAAKELRTQKKQINKNNINRTVDKNIVDYAFITGLNLGHIEKELIKETRKKSSENNKTQKDIPMAMRIAAKKRSAECLAAFKTAVDELFIEGVKLTNAEVTRRGNGAFSKGYINVQPQARAYFDEKKAEQEQAKLTKANELATAKELVNQAAEAGYDLDKTEELEILAGNDVSPSFFYTNADIKAYIEEVKKIMSKATSDIVSASPKAVTIKEKSENIVLSVKDSLSSLQLDYVFGAIKILEDEDPDELLSIDRIMALIKEGFSCNEFSKKMIEDSKKINTYIAEKNQEISYKNIVKRVKQTLKAMSKENLSMNMYNVLNRCELTVSYVEEHAEILEMIRKALA